MAHAPHPPVSFVVAAEPYLRLFRSRVQAERHAVSIAKTEKEARAYVQELEQAALEEQTTHAPEPTNTQLSLF